MIFSGWDRFTEFRLVLSHYWFGDRNIIWTIKTFIPKGSLPEKLEEVNRWETG